MTPLKIISEPGCQLFKLVAMFSVGRALESKRGLVQSVAAMMKKETTIKSNSALHQYLDRYSIQIEIYSTPSHLVAELNSHIDFIAQAIPIFFEILYEAKFSNKHWKIVQNQTIEYIKSQENQTDFWADKLLTEYIIGENHPLGYYSTPEDYLSITCNDIQVFYSHYIQHTKPTLFLAGDALYSVKKNIKQISAGYSFSKSEFTTNLELIPPKATKLSKKIASSSQASVRLGKLIPRASFDDFIEMELWNMMLGGHFMSELMNILRIKKGLTYGVYSYFTHLPQYSYFQIAFETDEHSIDSSLDEINKLFKRLKKKDIDFSESAIQHYSQWSKNAERSLQEIMYEIRMYKLGYDYTKYKEIMKKYKKSPPLYLEKYRDTFLDYNSYSISIVS